MHNTDYTSHNDKVNFPKFSKLNLNHDEYRTSNGSFYMNF